MSVCSQFWQLCAAAPLHLRLNQNYNATLYDQNHTVFHIQCNSYQSHFHFFHCNVNNQRQCTYKRLQKHGSGFLRGTSLLLSFCRDFTRRAAPSRCRRTIYLLAARCPSLVMQHVQVMRNTEYENTAKANCTSNHTGQHAFIPHHPKHGVASTVYTHPPKSQLRTVASTMSPQIKNGRYSHSLV